ncbi:MAG: hypothetical protein ACI845_002438 [Gammaproteobacteria bacterium]|jgi:hypothetical protein
MKSILKAFILMVGIFPLLVYSAAPEWYPEKFALVGVVDQIDGNKIIISDRRYILSPVAGLSTPTFEKASISELKPGVMVGAEVSTINNRRLIQHIWVLTKEQKKIYKFAP